MQQRAHLNAKNDRGQFHVKKQTGNCHIYVYVYVYVYGPLSGDAVGIRQGHQYMAALRVLVGSGVSLS